MVDMLKKILSVVGIAVLGFTLVVALVVARLPDMGGPIRNQSGATIPFYRAVLALADNNFSKANS